MKTKRFFQSAMLALTALLAISSCDTYDDDAILMDVVTPNVLVTIKPLESGRFYMQLDNKTTLWPTNMTASPYGMKEVRALANCYQVAVDAEDEEAAKYDKAVYVNRIDSIRTKQAVEYPAGDVDKLYGNDPIELVNDWVSVAEDGYLTLRFCTLWGNTGTVHYLNLLTGKSPDAPYEVELRHNANGDTSGNWGYGIIAFKVPALVSAGGKEVKLKLKYKSYTGDKTVTFNYYSAVGGEVDGNSSMGSYALKIQ